MRNATWAFLGGGARLLGAVHVDGVPRRQRVEWLAAYRVEDGLIREINLLVLVDKGID